MDKQQTTIWCALVLTLLQLQLSSGLRVSYKYQVKALSVINNFRAKHNAQSMQLDHSLNDVAFRCANYYANMRKSDYTCPYKNWTTGENLFAIKGSYSMDKVARMATKSWMNEEKYYNFLKPHYSGATKEFTQLVWRESRKMGFGVAQRNGYTTAVATFSPVGNRYDQIEQNVYSENNQY